MAYMIAFKVFLALLAAIRDWHLIQLDLNNAFLKESLDEVDLPRGNKERLVITTVVQYLS